MEKRHSKGCRFSLYQAPLREFLKSADHVDIVTGDLHDLRVGLAVDGVVTDGTAELDRLAGDLCLSHA